MILFIAENGCNCRRVSEATQMFEELTIKSLGPPLTVVSLLTGVEESSRCPKATARTKQEAAVIFAGVAVASSCQIVLPVFGALFFIVGTVLTIASYRGPEIDEDPEQYADRVNLTSNLRVFGPCCLAIGIAMLTAGVGLCLLARRNKHNNITFHCPIHGDFYPLSASHNHILPLRKRSSLGVCGKTASQEGLPTPQCPHSNRSSVSNGPPPQSSPLPPVTTHHTSSGFLTPTTLPLGESTGSTQSLAISYDVASFPHSRTTSPTPEIDYKHSFQPVDVEEQNVEKSIK